jgi:hypothetical protein
MTRGRPMIGFRELRLDAVRRRLEAGNRGTIDD